MTKESKHAEHRFWTCSPQQTCVQLGCTMDGLTATEASERLDRYGPNSDAPAKAIGPLRAALRRLLEPLSLILLVAGVISILTGDTIGGTIIVLILTISIGLDTVQEGHAVRTPKSCAARWRSRPRSSATVFFGRSRSKESFPATSCASALATSSQRMR